MKLIIFDNMLHKLLFIATPSTDLLFAIKKHTLACLLRECIQASPINILQ
jgi:hypothetical protein